MADFLRYVEQVRDVGATLSRKDANAAVRAMLAGEASDEDIAALLTAIAKRGERVSELTGFAEAIREHAVPLALTEAECAELVDTCGTGGDGQGTFNISTGAALVAAAAGAKVAKHGNRAVTSACGSADVLEALGVSVALPAKEAVECLRATGFTFLYAPSLNPSLKRVQAVRKALGFRTIFNLAGPLSNPANARTQIMGVFAADRIAVVAQSMANLGVRHAFVVYGLDGLDELTVTGESMVAEVRNQPTAAWDRGVEGPGDVRHYRVHPHQAGLEMASLDQLRGGDTAAENAAILEAILNGEKGPKRDVVLLNAAGALSVADIAADIREGTERAAAAIDSGAAMKTLEALREFSRRTQPTNQPDCLKDRAV
jgi:anthranilate phosphoribosyltransferase